MSNAISHTMLHYAECRPLSTRYSHYESHILYRVQARYMRLCYGHSLREGAADRASSPTGSPSSSRLCITILSTSKGMHSLAPEAARSRHLPWWFPSAAPVARAVWGRPTDLHGPKRQFSAPISQHFQMCYKISKSLRLQIAIWHAKITRLRSEESKTRKIHA